MAADRVRRWRMTAIRTQLGTESGRTCPAAALNKITSTPEHSGFRNAIQGEKRLSSRPFQAILAPESALAWEISVENGL